MKHFSISSTEKYSFLFLLFIYFLKVNFSSNSHGKNAKVTRKSEKLHDAYVGDLKRKYFIFFPPILWRPQIYLVTHSGGPNPQVKKTCW